MSAAHGSGIFPNMSTTRVHVQGEPRPPHLSGNSPGPESRSGPGSSNYCTFPWSQYMQIFYVPFKSRVAAPPNPVGLLQLSSDDLQSQMLWCLIFLVLDPRLGSPQTWGSEPPLLRRHLFHTYSQSVCCPHPAYRVYYTAKLAHSDLPHSGCFFMSLVVDLCL